MLQKCSGNCTTYGFAWINDTSAKISIKALSSNTVFRVHLVSETMSVRLTHDRTEELVLLCNNLLTKYKVKIRKFAQLVGKMVAADPGVKHAPLFYKPLELVKENGLRASRGDYDCVMRMPITVKHLLSWWVHNLPSACKLVSHGRPSVIIYSDASNWVGGPG